MDEQQRKSKQAEYNRKYYLANRERIARQRLERAAKDPDAVRTAAARWRDANRELLKTRYEKNRSKSLQRSRKYYEANCDRIKSRRRQHYAANAEAERASKAAYRKANPHVSRAYYLANKEAIHRWSYQYLRRRQAEQPSLKVYAWLLRNMSRALTRHLQGRKVTAKSKIVRCLGCSWCEFMAHIERQFQPGMTWANHGRSGWHFDHIRPLSSFDLTDESQLLAAAHFSNVQPLWAADNIRKGNKIA